MLCLHVMSVYQMHAYCLQRPVEGNESPGTAGVRKIVSATWVWGQNLGPLQEESALNHSSPKFSGVYLVLLLISLRQGLPM